MLESVFFFASVSSSLLAASRAFGSNGSVAERCQHLARTFGEGRRRSRAYRSLPRRVPGTSCAARGGTRGSRCRSRWGHPRSRRRHPWWRARFTRPRVWQSHHSDQSFQVLKKADAVGRALSEATSESALFTLPFRSASERAALRLPRVVETHSGAPEPQVSHPPHSLAPRASFPDHRARTHPTPHPFRTLLVSERKSAFFVSYGPRSPCEEASTRIARRSRSPQPRGRTHARARRCTAARVPPPARADLPPPSTRNRGCRKPHPSHPKTSRSRSFRIIRRHASHREPRGHAGEQQARASPHHTRWRS